MFCTHRQHTHTHAVAESNFACAVQMADEHDDADGGDQLVAGEDQHVDDSQLKLPEFDRAAFNSRVASGEEDEDVLFKR